MEKKSYSAFILGGLIALAVIGGLIYSFSQNNQTQDWLEFAKQAKTEADCEKIPPTHDEKSSCYLFVAKIKKDSALCEKAGTWKELCKSELSEANTLYSEEKAKALIADRASEVIEAMKSGDFSKLSTYVHPQKGVRFSPYSHVDIKNDVALKADTIKNAPKDTTTYVWGLQDGSGEPIKLTFSEYFKRFVYSHDFAKAKEVSYNRTIGKGNTLNNVFETYPHSIVVEYYFHGFDPKFEGMDWESLRLVFEELNGTWFLVGVGHDQWTI